VGNGIEKQHKSNELLGSCYVDNTSLARLYVAAFEISKSMAR
jgi:hypothetical protein